MDWFGAGEIVFKEGSLDETHFPGLDDQDAQLKWLAGFGAAWAECPEDEAVPSATNGDGMGGESVEEALVRTLEARPELLRALWALGLGKIPRVLH
jgi:hypothetical protein